MTLTDNEKTELDLLAQSLPKWQTHLAEFREKHPELSPQDVMKKAGFTFRMKKGKMISNYLKPKFKEIMEKVLKGAIKND